MQVPTSTTPLSTDALAVTSCRLYPCRFFVRAHMLLHLIALAWPGFSQQQRMHAIAATVIEVSTRGTLRSDTWLMWLAEKLIPRSYHLLDYD